MPRYSFVVPLGMLLLFVACGGGSGGNSGSNNSTNGSCTGAGSGSAAGQAVTVTTAAAQTCTGMDITVATPVASTPPNAQFLGVGSTLAVTGAQISVGQAGTVGLCGAGLSANMQVRLSGPGDITIANIRGTTCTSSSGSGSTLPGIVFDVTVPAGAALGGRTVFLQDTQSDITAFSGGLEVIP